VVHVRARWLLLAVRRILSWRRNGRPPSKPCTDGASYPHDHHWRIYLRCRHICLNQGSCFLAVGMGSTDLIVTRTADSGSISKRSGGQAVHMLRWRICTGMVVYSMIRDCLRPYHLVDRQALPHTPEPERSTRLGVERVTSRRRNRIETG
jgi:hypothetical protein